MTSTDIGVTLAALSERIESLADLFRRRLLDDRVKQSVIEDLQSRLTRAEKTLDATSLKPLVGGLSLLIERLQTADPSVDLLTSIIDELNYVIESLDVVSISPSAGDLVDRLRHEIASATGEGTELRVASLVRTGYEKGGVVLRPAKITACRVVPGLESGSEAGA